MLVNERLFNSYQQLFPYHIFQFFYFLGKCYIFFHHSFDFFGSMHHSSVISFKGICYLNPGQVCHLSWKVHGNLPWPSDVLLSRRWNNIINAYFIEIRYYLFYKFKCNFFFLLILYSKSISSYLKEVIFRYVRIIFELDIV